MRVAIITALRHGIAGEFLSVAADDPRIDVAMVIFTERRVMDRHMQWKRLLRKLRRIGLGGGLLGLHLRRWNRGFPSQDLFEAAARHDVPVETTPTHNCELTRELLRRADVELGLVLGTGILAPSVFEIPKRGMINVHGDVLPRFRGGASVIWPIYEGVGEAGFTVHQIDRGIDTGPILHIERFPIRFEATLEATYRANVAEIQRRVPPVLARIVANYEEYEAKETVQSGGRTYTSPTLRQFAKMLRQHRRMLRAQGARPLPTV